MRRTLLSLTALAALAAAPAAARAQTFSLEAFGGYQNLHGATPSDVTNATKGSEGTGIVGGQVLAGLGPLGVGASVDKNVSGSSGQPWDGSVLAGFLIPVPYVRIELLGELGRSGIAFGDIFKSAGATFAGVRPGLSFRIPATDFMIGASGLIRWPTSHGDFGSPNYGVIGRVGIGFF